MIKLKKQIHCAATAVFYKATHYVITQELVIEYRRGWAGKKVGMGHHFCARKKGWVKKHHAIHWGWAMNNYASVYTI